MKRRTLLALFLLCAPLARAADLYYAQSSAGSNNGASCANAYAYNDGANGLGVSATWTAGNTLHLCGTFSFAGGQTTVITSQGAGTSGNRITLKFESGANFTAPYWGGNVIHIVHNFVTVDGGTNGIIQATANGTGLANQNTAGGCVRADQANNFTLQNLTCANLYVHACTPPASSCTDTSASTNAFLIADSSNATVANCTVHDVHWGIVFAPSAVSSLSNWTIGPNNYIYNIDHGIVPNIGNGTTATVTNVIVYGNHISNFQPWDDSANNNHHDCVHTYDYGNDTISGLYVYNNLCDGDWGQHANAGIYAEAGDVGGTLNTCYIFNNILAPSNGGTASGAIADYSTQGCTIVNNTIPNLGTSSLGSLNGYTTAGQPGTTWYNNVISGNTTLQPAVLGDGHSGLINASDYNAFSQMPSASSGNGFIGPNGGCCNSLSQWQSAGRDTHAVLSGSSGTGALSNFKLDLTTFVINSGSPLIQKGKNLSSTCNGQPNPGLGALCFDKNGVPRPASGAWDIGAIQFGTVGPPPAPGLALLSFRLLDEAEPGTRQPGGLREH